MNSCVTGRKFGLDVVFAAIGGPYWGTQGSHEVLRTMDIITYFLATCHSRPVFLAKPLQLEARVWGNLQHLLLLLKYELKR